MTWNQNNYNKQYHEKKKEAIAKRKKNKRLLNIDDVREKEKISYQKNKLKKLEYEKKFYEKNKNKVLKQQELYRKKQMKELPDQYIIKLLAKFFDTKVNNIKKSKYKSEIVECYTIIQKIKKHQTQKYLL